MQLVPKISIPRRTPSRLGARHVRDTAGRPIAGATVFGVVLYEDGHIGVGLDAMSTRTTVTDAQGKYRIAGSDLFGVDAAVGVVATKKGMPPVMATQRAPNLTDSLWPVERTSFPPDAVNLVMPPRGGQLDVSVSMSGHPVAGATVWLSSGFRSNEALADDSRSAEFIGIVSPTAKSGPDGVAHFTDLLPSLYSCGVRTERVQNSTLLDSDTIEDPVPIGSAEGIPVQIGRTTTQHIVMYDWPQALQAFGLNGPDRRPLVRTFTFDYGPPIPENWEYGGSPITCGADGSIHRQLRNIGIGAISLFYGVTPDCDAGSPPYMACTTYVGVSPRLSPNLPVHATTRRVDAANVFVQLLDPAGKHIRGFVKIGPTKYAAVKAGATDAQGRVEFAQLS
jgi:hypothetical protein